MSDPAKDFSQPDADLDPQKADEAPAERDAVSPRDYSRSDIEGESEAEEDADDEAERED